jgi:pyruvate formate-lyase activating enzyme-like uncharacterized protein
MKESGQKESFIESARREYGDGYDRLKWVSARQAAAAAEEREKLLLWLGGRGAEVFCGGTKPVCHGMSPGCRRCAAGEWSCLFINGVCNGTCFFCPADQTEMGEPTTQTLRFNDPEDYADYIGKFRFKGVSMSGGEPLLSFERTISFISAVRNSSGGDVHLWIYTNGKLVTREKLQALKEAGVDEIRFNIYAHHDFLEKIRTASGLIDSVTVEVPAIPEDLDSMKKTMEDLRHSGVRFLNLHQLRLTPHNFRHLSTRGYTFLHGPRVTVLESELTALKLMKYNLETGIGLAINYCSFPYKNRYQKAAERRRHAQCMAKPFEDLTEAGMIRSMCIKGPRERLREQAKILNEKDAGNAWELNSAGECLHFSRACWPHIDFSGLSLFVRYHDTSIRSSVSYRNMFREIRLNERQKVIIERWPACDEIELTRGDIVLFGRRYMGMAGVESAGDGNRKSSLMDDLEQFELIRQGLSDYY